MRTERKGEAEILDALPPGHPDAVASRKDLRLFNAYLGTMGWFSRRLLPLLQPTDRVLEPGAGQGELSRVLFQKALEGRGFRGIWRTLDLHLSEIEHRNGVLPLQGDLLDFREYAEVDVLLGNMILHHFNPEELRRLGRLFQKRARLLIFQEPLRSPLHLYVCRCCFFLMSRVTRHDAPASIRAGFRGPELPQLLALDREEWGIELSFSKRGAYRMLAWRT